LESVFRDFEAKSLNDTIEEGTSDIEIILQCENNRIGKGDFLDFLLLVPVVILTESGRNK